MILETKNETEIGGFRWDAETGECLGSSSPRWVPETVEDVERIGRTMADIDADIAAIEARRTALNANLDAMAAYARRRRESLEYLYGPAIQKVARENLPKGSKTWRCPWLSVAFRATPARLAVDDHEKAVAWASGMAPEAVVTKTEFKVSLLSKEMKSAIMESEDGGKAAGLSVVPGGESVTIQTGVRGGTQ